MKKAVVLLSGGIDSTTTLAIAKSESFEIYALGFDYGQKHKIELRCASSIAETFNVKKHLIISFNLRDIGGSALTADIDVPGRDKNTPDSSTIPVTYVPARNTIFLSFALAWAETLEAPDIFIGANTIDYSGYPDCRPEFIRAFEKMANLATKISVEGKIKFNIRSPLINLSKAQIIQKGADLGVDYSLTWSCYNPQPSTGAGKTKHGRFIPCRQCDSCHLRAKGFKEAGIKDPAGDI